MLSNPFFQPFFEFKNCSWSRSSKERSNVSNQSDDRRSHSDNEHRRKYKKYQWNYELDGGLGGHFFRLLPVLGPQRFGKGAQGLCDWSTETLRLRKHCHEHT